MTEQSSLDTSPDSAVDSASDATTSGGGPTFDVLPLSAEVRQTLDEIGYVHPTPVQIAVWDPATRHRDAVVQARTGTGKTAAFGLPIVDHLVRRALAAAQVLVLCPTRELAVQVSGELDRLGRRKEVRVLPVYGGAPMQRQIDALASGAQVVVGTPGRVLDHIKRGTLKTDHIRLLVLDESDEMLSMGFEKELTAILDQLPAERQTLLFSATVPPDIERIAKNKLKTPEFITLSGDHIGALEIDHYVYMVATDKRTALLRILEVENPESAVIFCNTKEETENVATLLASRGHMADWLNGDLPQSEREKVMSATREGRLRYLVATDVAARGIDISHLTHVINFDFPQDSESYVHRTGRTGRAGRTGTAIALITPKDIGNLYMLRLIYKIRPLEKQLPSAGELKTRTEMDLVQMLAEAYIAKGKHPDDLSLARRILTHDEAESIVAGMLRDYLGARPSAQEDAGQQRREHIRLRERTRSRDGRSRDRRPRPTEESEAERRPDREPRLDRAPARADAPARPIEAPAPRVNAPRAPRDRPAPEGEGRPADVRAHVEPTEPREPRRPRRDRGEGQAEPRRDSRERSRPAARQLADWTPPEEEGDDQPILAPGPRGRDDDRSALARTHDDDEFGDLYVSVGRRDGARAADLAQLFIERAGLDKDEVRKIRVRERHSFVNIRKTSLSRALAGIAGATLGGRPVSAEPARAPSGTSQSLEGPAPGDAPAGSKGAGSKAAGPKAPGSEPTA